MDTKYPVLVAIAFALTGMMFTMSGASAAFGGQGGAPALEEDVNDSAEESSANESDFESDTRSAGSIVGFVISAASQVANFAGLVIGLPVALQQLGFPRFFAYPIGLATQLLVSVGFVQFVSGRVFR